VDKKPLIGVCLPVLANEGKPDLIVDCINIHYYHSGIWMVDAIVKNIGNASTSGVLTLTYTVKRIYLGTTLISDTKKNNVIVNAGDKYSIFLFYKGEIPFGFIELKCTVNQDKSIEESNYENNELSQKYFVLFGLWKQIV
jgi:hypothetical protein